MLLEETEEGRAVLPPAEDTADQQATSGAYWHHSMENEEEHREYVEDRDVEDRDIEDRDIEDRDDEVRED
jgi:hypothetical protein